MSKAKKNNSVDRKAERERLKSWGFPMSLNVSVKEVGLGSITINYTREQHEIKELNPKDFKTLEEYLDAHIKENPWIPYGEEALPVLRELAPHLKRIVELEIDLLNKFPKERRRLRDAKGNYVGFLFSGIYPISLFNSSLIGGLISLNSDKIFELIRLAGSMVMCFPSVQEKMSEWLSDNDRASEKVNKLKDALLEYSKNQSSSGTAPKAGRPKLDVSDKLNNKDIFMIYYITLIFVRHIKRRHIGPGGNKWNTGNLIKILHKEGAALSREHMMSGISVCSKRDIEKKKKEDAIHLMDSACKRKLNLYSPILWSLENNNGLKNYLLSFEWTPSDLAKKITADLLDCSESYVRDQIKEYKNNNPA